MASETLVSLAVEIRDTCWMWINHGVNHTCVGTVLRGNGSYRIFYGHA